LALISKRYDQWQLRHSDCDREKDRSFLHSPYGSKKDIAKPLELKNETQNMQQGRGTLVARTNIMIHYL